MALAALAKGRSAHALSARPPRSAAPARALARRKARHSVGKGSHARPRGARVALAGAALALRASLAARSFGQARPTAAVPANQRRGALIRASAAHRALRLGGRAATDLRVTKLPRFARHCPARTGVGAESAVAIPALAIEVQILAGRPNLQGPGERAVAPGSLQMGLAEAQEDPARTVGHVVQASTRRMPVVPHGSQRHHPVRFIL
jgi:hypothetical protein